MVHCCTTSRGHGKWTLEVMESHGEFLVKSMGTLVIVVTVGTCSCWYKRWRSNWRSDSSCRFSLRSNSKRPTTAESLNFRCRNSWKTSTRRNYRSSLKRDRLGFSCRNISTTTFISRRSKYSPVTFILPTSLGREHYKWKPVSVCLSVACLDQTPEQKGLRSPKLAGWKPITQVIHELV